MPDQEQANRCASAGFRLLQEHESLVSGPALASADFGTLDGWAFPGELCSGFLQRSAQKVEIAKWVHLYGSRRRARD